jgi:proteasome lid subunit RPN8/RPN11
MSAVEFPYAPTGADDDDFRVLAVQVRQPQSWALGIPATAFTDFPVFISQAAVMNILRHGEQGLLTEREVAGALVGTPGYDPQTGLVFTRIVTALAVAGTASQYEVEIPPEEWSRLSTPALEEAPYWGAPFLVGWYHSHPAFDAYLSALDQQTQAQFFDEEWHIAIVVSPARHQIRAFHGAGGDPCPLYVDPDETGGILVPVTYAVTPGPVSTPAGIEWLLPPGLDPDGVSPTSAVSWLEAVPPDPGVGDTDSPAGYGELLPSPDADYVQPAWPPPRGPFDLSSAMLGLILLAFVLGMVCMLILILVLRPLLR